MRLYVGNLPYQASEQELQDWFAQAGVNVDNVNFVRDRFSGEMRGFGFVETTSQQDGETAIRSCNGRDFLGRSLTVNEARPMNEGGRSGGGGGGGERRRNGGGGGGGRRQSW
jgi:cold-inducible RNA-binding protein